MVSEFPLFVFTTCAGLSAGAYVAAALFPAKEDRCRPWIFKTICLILLAVGTLGVMFHLGRPAMFINALANPSAGIAQEAYLTIAFGILLVIDLVIAAKKGSSPRLIVVLAAVAGVALTVVMGLSYVANLGVPAWTSWATVPLFVVGDLAMGFALYGLFVQEIYERLTFLWTSLVIEVVLAIVLIAEAVHFANLGLSSILFAVAVVVGPVAVSVLSFAAKKGNKRILAWAVFACALVGVCLARWAFYAACAA